MRYSSSIVARVLGFMATSVGFFYSIHVLYAAGLTVNLGELGSITVVEGGRGGTGYTIALSTQPTAPVTVTLIPTNQISLSTTEVVFTEMDYNNPATIFVTAVNDGIAEGTHPTVITYSFSSDDPEYNGLLVNPTNVTIQDDDTAGFSGTQPDNLVLAEGGATDTFNFSIFTAPTSTVTVTFSSDDQLYFSPTSVQFTADNFADPQTISVGALDDVIAEGDHGYNLYYTVSSGDSVYHGFVITTSTGGTITDNDTAGVTVTQSDGATRVVEGGATDSFTIVLNTAPTSSVDLVLTATDQVTLSEATVTFTSSTYNVPVTITVTPVDDSTVEGAHRATISYVLRSGDLHYDAFVLADTTVEITDNDSAARGGGGLSSGAGGTSSGLAPFVTEYQTYTRSEETGDRGTGESISGTRELSEPERQAQREAEEAGVADRSMIVTPFLERPVAPSAGPITIALLNNLKEAGLSPHFLVKLPDDENSRTQVDSAVYYVGMDGRRHAFPSDQVFFTWYPDFSGVQVISLEEMSRIPLGPNVTYKPGKKMVTFYSGAAVYVVSYNGILRRVVSEAVAEQMYGPDWRDEIEVVSEALFINYLFGTAVKGLADFDPVRVEASVQAPSDSLIQWIQ